MKKGFTLTELLLALVVAGVIMVLTIPVLITRVHDKAFTAQLKSTIENIEQVAQDEFVNRGVRDLTYTDFADPDKLLSEDHFYITKICSASDAAANCWKTSSTADDKITYRTSTGASSSIETNARTAILKNGVVINYKRTAGSNQYVGYFVVDVNGNDKPNMIGKDLFTLYITPKGVVKDETDDNFIAYTPITLTLDGVEYTFLKHHYYYKNANGDLVDSSNSFSIYTKIGDGIYKARTNFGNQMGYTLYDENLKAIKSYTDNGENYDVTFENSCCYKYSEDGSGNLVTPGGTVYTKTSNGYEYTSGSYNKYVYDNDMNMLGEYRNGVYYKIINMGGSDGDILRDAGDGTGNLVSYNGRTYIKTSDGYEKTVGSEKYVHDNDLQYVGLYKNGEYYTFNGNTFTKDAGDGTGDLYDQFGNRYTKRSDGLYQNGSLIYDATLKLITAEKH